VCKSYEADVVFNSLTFFIFFGIVVCLYYGLSHRLQNRMLLLASYVFYGCWDWRFLSLILISTVTDYLCGIQIYNQPSSLGKRKYLYVSLIINLALLGFFKYWNFFAESFVGLLLKLGINGDLRTFSILLPIGISFYTFKTMSYAIDIYRGEFEPTYDFFDYALFVAFFPALIAGPIDRAKNLLPQIQKQRQVNRSHIFEGLQLIFWGLFKKVFVADNLGIIVNQIYNNPASTGIEYIVATWAFAFQIYGDFSGYTDMARGTSMCLGIELTQNFKQPYLSINPSDFWRRWHISLSSWLRDYVYIPLGGNRKEGWKTYRNLLLTMLVCGLWHGAAWNFVIWGAYHGFLLSLHRIFRKEKKSDSTRTSSLWSYMPKAIVMFQLTSLGWIFFRAQSLAQIKLIFSRIFNLSWSTSWNTTMLSQVCLFSALPMLAMAFQTIRELRPSWFSETSLLRHFQFSYFPLPAKSAVYGVLIYLLCFYGAKAQTFIYFQF
jgi:D-alanyl-lipoteichoic acid acyltransferase DltB (MBOAT superfamily)